MGVRLNAGFSEMNYCLCHFVQKWCACAIWVKDVACLRSFCEKWAPLHDILQSWISFVQFLRQCCYICDAPSTRLTSSIIVVLTHSSHLAKPRDNFPRHFPGHFSCQSPGELSGQFSGLLPDQLPDQRSLNFPVCLLASCLANFLWGSRSLPGNMKTCSFFQSKFTLLLLSRLARS